MQRPPQALPLPGSYVLLSHLRWIAALMVVLAHIQQTLLGRHRLTAARAFPHGLINRLSFSHAGYGHAAVVVFFVLSGFLVGGKLIELNGPTLGATWQSYLVDRFTRIFIVLWPALLLAACVLAAIQRLCPHAGFIAAGGWSLALDMPLAYDNSLWRWVCAPLLLNELLAPTLQVDAPLWSLAYEWVYYMVSLAALLALRRIASPGAGILMTYATALLCLALYVQPEVLMGGLVWAAGLAARLAYNRRLLRGSALQYLGLAAVGVALVLIRFVPMPDLALGLALALMIAHPGWTRLRLAAPLADRLAAMSFSLYAIHFPILVAILAALNPDARRPHPLSGPTGFAVAAAALGVIVALTYVFSALTERHSRRVRNILSHGFIRTAAVGHSPAPAQHTALGL